MDKKEISTIFIASLILALAAGFKNTEIFYPAALSFFIILTLNVLTKKVVGYHFETDVKTKFWTWYQFGIRKDMHFKAPVPMAWLPLLIALFSKGFVLWLAILEFDIKAKTERVAKRHGIYRFTEVTEWNVAWIATWGLIINLVAAIFAYVAGFELFAKLSVYFIAWSILPLSRLDGAKIFYASRALWVVILTITAIILGWGLMI
ncbi:hypothetical protein HN903_04610 [archaeon]|jgi:hypothetical protein|nr:hypothetical protein [archaeon]MBT7129010.1 hypothetical protein [archaeon]